METIVRNDKKGRNSVEKLQYYNGAFNLIAQGYASLNIHEKITVRSYYCGVEYPSVMVKEALNLIEF